MGATGYIIKGSNGGRGGEARKEVIVSAADGTIDVEKVETFDKVDFRIKTTYDGYETISVGSQASGGYFKAAHIKFNEENRRYRLVCILNGGSYIPVAKDFAIYYIKFGWRTGGVNADHWYIEEYSRQGNGAYVSLEQIALNEYNVLIHTPTGYAYANIGILKEDKEPDVTIDHFNNNTTRYTPTGTIIETETPAWKNGALVDTNTEDLKIRNGLLQLADRSSIDGLGYVILRPDKTLAEQVVYTNTIYEVRYNFDLNGASVTIPTGCTLKFDGGSFINGIINASTLKLEGDVKICRIGSVNNLMQSEVFSNWFISDIKYSLESIFSSSSRVTLKLTDNIVTDGSVILCNSLNIEGNGYTWTNPFSFSVKGDINISNIRFIDCSSSVVTTSPEYNDFAKVLLNNITAKGNGAEAFYSNTTANQTDRDKGQTISIDLKNSIFDTFTHYGIQLKCTIKDSVIDGNTFSNIGEENVSHGATAIMCGVDLNQSEGGEYTSNNVTISNNSIGVVVGNYTTAGDTREVHSILLYGYNCRIVGNQTFGVSSSFSSIETIGQDAESIYVKGNYCTIETNYVIDGCGELSDGSIALKGSNVNNIIRSNTIINNYYGRCILVHRGGNVYIENNILKHEGTDFVLYSECFNSIVRNNHIECLNTEYKNRSGVYVAGHSAYITDNDIQNFIPCMHLMKSVYTTEIAEREVIIDNNSISVSVPENVDYSSFSVNSIIRLEDTEKQSDNDVRCTFKNNRVSITGASLAPFYINNFLFFNNNIKIEKSRYGGELYHMLGYQRCNIFGNLFDLDSDAIPLNRNAGISNIKISNNAFQDKIPRIFGGVVSGNTSMFIQVIRPANPQIGTTVFDVNLGKPIYWTGSKWVDATGADLQ